MRFVFVCLLFAKTLGFLFVLPSSTRAFAFLQIFFLEAKAFAFVVVSSDFAKAFQFLFIFLALTIYWWRRRFFKAQCHAVLKQVSTTCIQWTSFVVPSILFAIRDINTGPEEKFGVANSIDIWFDTIGAIAATIANLTNLFSVATIYEDVLQFFTGPITSILIGRASFATVVVQISRISIQRPILVVPPVLLGLCNVQVGPQI